MNNSASQRMTKRQVCEYLGKSQRTVEGYMLRGYLSVSHVPGPNGSIAIFERADVRKFKKAWARRGNYEALVERGHIDPAANAVAARPIPRKPLALPPAAAQLPAPVETLGRWLDLDAAAKFSNLPKAFLIREARAGRFGALNVSGSPTREVWRFRVADGGIIGKS